MRILPLIKPTIFGWYDDLFCLLLCSFRTEYLGQFNKTAPSLSPLTKCDQLSYYTLPTHSLEKRFPALDWSRNFVKLSVPWHATFLDLNEQSQTMHQPQKPWGLMLPISNRLLFPDSISSRGPWQGWWIESIVYQFLLILLYFESSLGEKPWSVRSITEPRRHPPFKYTYYQQPCFVCYLFSTSLESSIEDALE